MSDNFRVPYTTIREINIHPNADRLVICKVYDFNVITQKDKYKVGDEIIFIPPDSVIPTKLEQILFPVGSKIILYRRRVRQIRIRGIASQGMIVDPKDIIPIIGADRYRKLGSYEAEENLAEELEITKYEPPVPGFAQTLGKDKQRNKAYAHPMFHRYNGIDNIKWYPDLFVEGEEVVVQTKVHGTNARAAILPYIANTWWKKLLKFIGVAPSWQNCYGSNNVDISSKLFYSGGYYGEDIYGNVFKKINVFSKIKPGETVFGEIAGPGIQKGYSYGLTEHQFVLFDVKILLPDGKQKWLNPEEVEAFAKERGFDYVPVLYKGPYNKEYIHGLSKGPCVYGKGEKVKEGIVIKSRNNYDVEGNKKVVKLINEDYLDDKNNTDFH